MTFKLRTRSTHCSGTTLMWVVAMTWSFHQANGQTNISQLQSNICAITNCPFSPPALKSLDSASVVSPGGQVVLQGARFNSADGTPGQIVLKIGTKFPMQVIHLGSTQGGAYHQPYVERQLTNIKWADSHVFGQIPSDISGVMDGPATLEVWRSENAKPLLHPEDGHIVAIASDTALETRLPRFDLDDHDGITDFILRYNGFR